MKILMINVDCGVGSTGRICTDLADALVAAGHQVKIGFGRESNPKYESKYGVRIGGTLSVRIHALLSRMFDASGFGSIFVTKKFISWVKEYNPDVIHLHNLHGYYINLPILFRYLKRENKRLIWTLHDCWAFTGHSAYCDAVNCNKWKTGCNECIQKKEYPKSYIDFSKRNWKKKKDLFTGISNMIIVTPSKWLADLVKESFLKEYKVRVINNGINTEIFKPLENDFKEIFGINGKYMILGVASVWNDLKGLKDYIELSKLIDSDCVCVLIGLTEEQIQNLPKKIIGIKKTSSPKELAQIYSAADVFLNLTYCDNYPTVNLEAVSCGTPVITYNTGGSPESIFEYGYVVDKGNLQAIVNTINEMRKRNSDIYNPISQSKLSYKTTLGEYTIIYASDWLGGVQQDFGRKS